MKTETIEQAYLWLLEGSQKLQQVLEESFLEGYIENVGNFLQKQVHVENEVPDKQTQAQLAELYEKLESLSLSSQDWRKVSQLVLLKGMLTESIQANHQLTPDSIGFLLVYLIEQLTKEKQELVVLDETVGTGNLLLTVLTNLSALKKVSGYGIEIDETLIRVAEVNAELTGVELQLFYQDALRALPVSEVDVVVSDLPVGYYPDDDCAKQFRVAAQTEHTYAHHLLVEQGIRSLKAGGFAFFLLPTNVLESPQALLLKKWLQQKVLFQGVIQLPENLFQNKQAAKSIVLLQKPGKGAEQRELLVASLHSLSDVEEMKRFFAQFQEWCG